VRSNVAETTENHDIVLAIVCWQDVVRQAVIEGVVD
jgi:hypothetical protein